MTSTTTTPAENHAPARGVNPVGPPPRRGKLGRITVVSLGIGLVAAIVLTLVALPHGTEAVITGAGLIGLSLGWALLAVLSTRWTNRPQRWAALPAAAMGAAGAALLVLTPDDAALTAAGWVWAPGMLAVAVWSAARARRSLDTRARSRLVLPALVLLAVVSVGGGYQTVRVTLDSTDHPMPGRSVDIGEYALHLDCAGTGTPTVVLESGLGGASMLWRRVVADVSGTTRVCAYDRAGQGWSGSPDGTDSRHDAVAIAADLRSLLHRAGEVGPFVLVGHSVGGPYAMTFAAEHPADVAGMVLLDATDPYDVDASAAGKAGGANGPLALLPSLARMGLAQPLPSSAWSGLPAPAADEYRAYAVTARAMTNAVDEVSEYPSAFAQAQALTTLGARPLVVLTTADTARTDPGGYAVQERFAALSTTSSLRTADTTHQGMIEDEHGAASSARAVVDVVHAVRTATAVPQG